MRLIRLLKLKQCRAASSKASKATFLPVVKPDLSQVLTDPAAALKNIQRRNVPFPPEAIDSINKLHAQVKALTQQLAETQTLQNKLGKQGAEGNESARSEATILRGKAKEQSAELSDLETSLEQLAFQLPNTSHPSSPIGGYDACRIVRRSGKQPEEVAARPKAHLDHLSIAQQLGWVDFAAGATVTGSRWAFLTREAALLELALINYVMDKVVQHGFQPVLPPDVVKAGISDRCGFQPRDGEASQQYRVSSSDNFEEDSEALVLAGTAEVPLAGYFASSILPVETLPMKMVGLGRAFRAEAGARGKESRGLYRVHQFSKVEMFVVCAQEESEAMLEQLVAIQEDILSGLDLPLRLDRLRFRHYFRSSV